MAAQASVVLQSRFWEAARKEIEAQTVEIIKIQELLVAKAANQFQSPAKYGELTDKFSRVNLQYAIGGTVSDDLKLVAGACERPAKRA